MSRLKHKLKAFFKTRDTSEHGVELLRMFILPFKELWNSQARPDEVIEAFFATEHRKFYHGIAKRDFKMPGQVFMAGNRPVQRFGARDVLEGQKMLLAVDKKDQNARVDITLEGKYRTFLLTRAELEHLKSCIKVMEA